MNETKRTQIAYAQTDTLAIALFLEPSGKYIIDMLTQSDEGKWSCGMQCEPRDLVDALLQFGKMQDSARRTAPERLARNAERRANPEAYYEKNKHRFVI